MENWYIPTCTSQPQLALVISLGVLCEHSLQGQSATRAYDIVTFLSRESSKVSAFTYALFQYYHLFDFLKDIISTCRIDTKKLSFL